MLMLFINKNVLYVLINMCQELSISKYLSRIWQPIIFPHQSQWCVQGMW